ncbi:MAG: EF-hand domain-containing protein [Methylophilaceae bacterium]
MKFQFKNALLASSVLLTVVVFSAPAFSDDAMLSTGGYARELHQMGMMKMLDADGNHMVSKAEADSYYGELFDALDTNHDGSLDAKEWVGTKGHTKVSLTTGGYNRELRNMKMMKMMDTDGDHNVTKDEFLKYNESIFTAMDKNSDEQLDPQEWLARQTGNK